MAETTNTFRYPLQQAGARAAFVGGQRRAQVEERTFTERQRQFDLQLQQAKETQRQNQQKIEQAQKDQLFRTQQAQETLDIAKEQLKLAQDKFKQSSDVQLQKILDGTLRRVEEGETVETTRDGIGYTSWPRMLQPEPTFTPAGAEGGFDLRTEITPTVQPMQDLTTTILKEEDVGLADYLKGQPVKTTYPKTWPREAIPQSLRDKPLLAEEYGLAINEMEQARKPAQIRPKPIRSTYQDDRIGRRRWKTDIESWEVNKRKAKINKRKTWNTANQKRIDILKEAGKKPKELTYEQKRKERETATDKRLLINGIKRGRVYNKAENEYQKIKTKEDAYAIARDMGIDVFDPDVKRAILSIKKGKSPYGETEQRIKQETEDEISVEIDKLLGM